MTDKGCHEMDRPKGIGPNPSADIIAKQDSEEWALRMAARNGTGKDSGTVAPASAPTKPLK